MLCLTRIGIVGGGRGLATRRSLTGIIIAGLVLKLEEFRHATVLGSTSPSLFGILHCGCVLIAKSKTALIGEFALSFCAHASSTDGVDFVTLYE